MHLQQGNTTVNILVKLRLRHTFGKVLFINATIRSVVCPVLSFCTCIGV